MNFVIKSHLFFIADRKSSFSFNNKGGEICQVYKNLSTLGEKIKNEVLYGVKFLELNN